MPVAALPEIAEVAGAGAAEGGAAAEGGGLLSRFRIPFIMGGHKSAAPQAPKPGPEEAASYTSQMLNPHQFSPFG